MAPDPEASPLWRLADAAIVEETPHGGALTIPGKGRLFLSQHELNALLAFKNPKSVRRVLALSDDDEARAALRRRVDAWIELGVLKPAQATHGSAPVVTMFDATCPNLFFVYAGAQGGVLVNPLDFLRESGLSHQNVVLLKDPSQMWFLEGISARIDTFATFVAWHDGLLEGATHVRRRFCIGSSMGAFSAIVLGHTLGVDAVWCFGLSRTSVPVRNARGEPWNVERLIAEWNGVTRYHLHFNESWAPDREAAQRLARLPGVELHPHRAEGHLVLHHLLDVGELSSIFPRHERATPRLQAQKTAIGEREVLGVLRAILPQHRAELHAASQLSGILDSLTLVLLLECLEAEFGVRLDPDRLTQADFENVGAIVRAIARESQN